jgi:hypothetical protein
MKTTICTLSSSIFLRSLLVGVALVVGLAVRSVSASPHTPATIVGGTLTSNTTWTQGGTYQVESYLIVPAGVTLTIEAGVTVENYSGTGSQRYNFDVQGTLIANGTAAQPIHFNPGSTGWSGLSIMGGPGAINTGSSLSYVIFEGGGYGGSGVAGNLILQYANVDVHHCQFNHSPGDGILGDNAGSQGVANIYDTSFTGNQGYAVNFEDGTVNPILSNLTATGNGAALTVDGDVVNIDNATLHGAHVWENMGLPYLLWGTIVGSDSVLTIAPGVQVLAYDGNDTLDVQGSLVANGTASLPIRFDPVYPALGWSGIAILGDDSTHLSTGSLLNHVTITKGGFFGGCNLYVSYGDVTVTNSQLDGGQQSGVCLEHGADLVMTNTLLTNNQVYAMDVRDAGAQFTLDNLTATGNTSNTIGIESGTLLGDHTWYRSGINTYDLYGYVTIAPTGTLTIKPGVTVLFAEGIDLTVRGSLTALGTAASPILFTGETPTPGLWESLSFAGTLEQHAVGRFAYTTIEYGGYGGWGMVEIDQADVTFENCFLRHSAAEAIVVYPGTLAHRNVQDSSAQTVGVSWSKFTDNAGHAIDNQDPSTVVNAAYNWWDSPSGPAVLGNPGGTGEGVSGNVTYRPFLTSPEVKRVYLPLVKR